MSFSARVVIAIRHSRIITRIPQWVVCNVRGAFYDVIDAWLNILRVNWQYLWPASVFLNHSTKSIINPPTFKPTEAHSYSYYHSMIWYDECNEKSFQAVASLGTAGLGLISPMTTFFLFFSSASDWKIFSISLRCGDLSGIPKVGDMGMQPLASLKTTTAFGTFLAYKLPSSVLISLPQKAWG